MYLQKHDVWHQVWNIHLFLCNIMNYVGKMISNHIKNLMQIPRKKSFCDIFIKILLTWFHILNIYSILISIIIVNENH